MERACPLPRMRGLKAILSQRGLKAHHLAAALDVRPAVVFDWIYGRTDMPQDMRLRTARWLGVGDDQLD